MIRISCLILPALILVACNSAPKPSLGDASYGPEPSNEYNYAGWVKPEWRFEKPYRAAMRAKNESEWSYGHAVKMRFNRKQRYYGYSYNEKHTFFFTGSKMHRVKPGDRLRGTN